MLYRLEVKDDQCRWRGYYNGLRHWIGRLMSCDVFEQFSATLTRVACSLRSPDWDIIVRLPGNSYLFWATPLGWDTMSNDVEVAIEIANSFGIEWRILESEDPGKIVWQTEEQAIVLIPEETLPD